MKIAVLSGKGGTGKTFVSVNLAAMLKGATYVDCDVEAPNGNLYFKPQITDRKEVIVEIPLFHQDKCVGCKKCVEFCAFHALAFVKGKPMLFPEVCHFCGGCNIICSYDAVSEAKKSVGEVLSGVSGQTQFLSGRMKVGEVSGVPIIKKLLEHIKKETKAIIDCPPGSGCMVMESIQDADYCILVAEPTEFGRHNLEMIYELVQVFKKPFGVVLNKCVDEVNPSKAFCEENRIEIIASIPFDSDIGKKNADGEIAVYSNQTAIEIFETMSRRIEKKVNG